MKKENILMAMSGGIDSSISAMLLLEKGYDIQGATFLTTDDPSAHQAAADARQLADKIGINHTILDIRDKFRQTIISNFIEQYLAGRTPNPCVVCNPIIKWGELLKLADNLGCEMMATGHYAQIGRSESGRYFLRRGVDKSKDQTYFLWRLSQEQLSRTVFPLGEFTKPQVRELALERGCIEIATKKESQEICFVKDDDYRKFLSQNVPSYDKIVKKGDLIDVNGKRLGTHNGFVNYTIGQRKGLGIALGEPAYVTNIDATNNLVTIGKRELLQSTSCLASDPRFSKIEGIDAPIDALVKVRYRTEPVPCRIFNETKNSLRIEFYNPVESVTPGQSIVFYDIDAPDDLIGGAFIEKPER